MTGQDRVRVFGVVCLGWFLFSVWHEWNESASWLPLWLRGTLLMVSAIWAFIALHISAKPACRYSPAHLLITQYFINHVFAVLGLYFSRKLESQSVAFQATQDKFIINLLADHANTAYGRDHNFTDIKSVASFRERHPLTGYAHYASYMERVARGEKNVIIPNTVSSLCLTSGTTGKQKLIAQSKKRTFLFGFKYISVAVRKIQTKFAVTFSPLQKTCYFYTDNNPQFSEGGLPMGPVTVLRLPDFAYRIQYSTPPVGMRLTNESQAMYVHLLFALRDPDLQNLFAIFSTNIYCVFLKLEDEWPNLVDDLRRGRIGDHVGLDRDVKTNLELELQPEPARANNLEREFRKGFDGIAKRIWPRMSTLWGISSGAMAVYARRLEAKFTKGLPMVSVFYNATESLLGIFYDQNGNQIEYITLPEDVFYEFIPLDHSHEDQPDTLLAEEVQAGELYEIVLTSIDGLYRYRMGDIIRVVRFHNKAPILEYLYRSGDLLNLNGEKTPEICIRGAINDTLAEWKALTLVDYACAESPLYEESTGVHDKKRTAYYVIIAEVDGMQEMLNTSTMDRDKITSEVDANLRRHADRYNHHRVHGSIAPPQLVFVQPRSFVDLRDYVLSHSKASSMQIKLSKLLRKAEWIQLLADRELK